MILKYFLYGCKRKTYWVLKKQKKNQKATSEKAIGVSNAYVTSIRKSIDKDKIQSIALKFPDLNIDWLLYGKGEMLKKMKLSNRKTI
jgi:hypothetical protein